MKFSRFSFSIISVAIFFSLLILPQTIFASTSNGTIDSTNKYAKGLVNSVGTFNFGTTEGDVHVTDSTLTGYAWSNIYGWINLAPSGYGVVNDAEGNLSGYAWGQNIGWINFNPSSSGVRVQINSSGDFTGYAWGQNVGWIIFNCATNSTCSDSSFKVSTDWRPASTRSASSGGSGGGGGGGGNTPPYTESTPAPTPTPEPAPTEPPVEITPPPPPPIPEVIPPTPTVEIPPVTPPPETPTTPTTVVNAIVQGISNFFGGNGSSASEIFNSAIQQVKDSVTFAQQTVTEVAKQTQAVVNSPTGSVVTKTVSTVGVIGGGVTAASTLFLNPLSFSELLLIPLRLWGILLATFGLKKRRRPWGTVYDSVTKQPLDPAYVVLQDMQGNEVNTSITDLDGRYGFVLAPGSYKIVANKTNYIFPSKKLVGKINDELYSDLYFGEPLVVTDVGAIVTKNIPLDPEKFDWNEFAKGNKKLMIFYSKRARFMKRLSDVMFVFGFIIATIALFAAPRPYNTIIFGLYIILLILRRLGLRAKPHATVTEKETGSPLAFAIARIYSVELGQEFMHRVTDKFGRFFALVPQGKYYVTIEKKNDDESYTLVLTSPTFEAKNGLVDQTFSV